MSTESSSETVTEHAPDLRRAAELAETAGYLRGQQGKEAAVAQARADVLMALRAVMPWFMASEPSPLAESYRNWEACRAQAHGVLRAADQLAAEAEHP